MIDLSFLLSFSGTKTLQEILCERENISHSMQVHLDEGTDPWGVKVERVEMSVVLCHHRSTINRFATIVRVILFSKDVRLPVNMQRSMAAEAEGK